MELRNRPRLDHDHDGEETPMTTTTDTSTSPARVFVRSLAGLALAVTFGCATLNPSGSHSSDPGGDGRPDIHSFSRPGEARVDHIGLDLDANFEKKILIGTATLLIDRALSGRRLVLDTRDLAIDGVRIGVWPEGETILESRRNRSTGQADDGALPHLARELPGAVWKGGIWKLGQRDPVLGSALEIELPPGANVVRITYASSPAASGLQWLDPAQTGSKTDPFLYSQSQAINARSWVPCQDSPSVRFTFDAIVKSPRPVVMAARSADSGPHDIGRAVEYRFEMTQPIPSYLLAIASGRIEKRDVGTRSAVWAEPEMVDPAARELADTGKMLAAAERLFGPYRWGRYDLLILPPSFPFGGMENPRMTFATPTIIVGDRSLVSLVAHEMAHSWSGNLVTNATWSDFWLNEGFTTYFERRILESVYGKDQADMEWVLGRELLDIAIRDFEKTPGDQLLHIDLGGRDPDDAVTDIAYEKGSLFVRMLEETYGREELDRFLRAWFDGHAFQSVTTADFRRFALENLVDSRSPLPGHEKPDLEFWIDRPGLAKNTPAVRSSLFGIVDAARKTWLAGGLPTAELGAGSWITQQWNHFLRGLPPDLPAGKLAELDESFHLTASRNSEILADWLVIAANREYAAADSTMEEFLVRVGRRKYVDPVYRALMKDPASRDRARKIYDEARPGYQAITRRTIDQIVGWK